jgi:hypothetical protein
MPLAALEEETCRKRRLKRETQGIDYYGDARKMVIDTGL